MSGLLLIIVGVALGVPLGWWVCVVAMEHYHECLPHDPEDCRYGVPPRPQFPTGDSHE